MVCLHTDRMFVDVLGLAE